MSNGRKMLDLTGQRQNRLTAIKLIGKNKKGAYEWLCQCDCGNEHVTTSSNFRSGEVRSCGCLGNESRIKNIIKCNDLKLNNLNHNNISHGMHKEKLYSIWKAIKQRCTNPNYKRYGDYGGRGIDICDEWLHSPEKFMQDMKEGYLDGLSIDRKDNNKGYCKENCRWSTRKEQQRNKRNNRLVTIDGTTKTLIQHAEELGITRQMLAYKLKRNIDIKSTPK